MHSTLNFPFVNNFENYVILSNHFTTMQYLCWFLNKTQINYIFVVCGCSVTKCGKVQRRISKTVSKDPVKRSLHSMELLISSSLAVLLCVPDT